MYKSRYTNYDTLKEICELEIYEFHKFVDKLWQTPHGLLQFKDNGADVLAVGHLDTVQQKRTWRMSEKDDRIYSPQLDDRLGVYLFLDVLPKFGFKYDLLLTEEEESGNSTAQYFKYFNNKRYNHIIEIDRFGDDVALYGYWNEWLKEQLERYSFRVSTGSYTDICYLKDLNVMAMNFACCYGNNHTMNAWVDVKELDNQLDKIIKFMGEMQRSYMHFPNEKYGTSKPKSTYTSSYTSYGGSYRSYGKDREDYRYDDGVCSQDNSLNYMVVYGGDCPACLVKDCVGLEKCSVCGFSYHKDIVVSETGVCKDCLNVVFGDCTESSNIRKAIKGLNNSSVVEIEEYILTIKKHLGGKW